MKHWKQHIGIVGTEAKISQEELVKIRKKIWSLPLVLVTALLLVGLLGAAVLAQSKPAVETQIGDQTIYIGATGSVQRDGTALEDGDNDVNLADIDGSTTGDQPAFAIGSGNLAYTVMTGDTDIATVNGVGLTDGDGGVAAEWWDGLGDSPHANADCGDKANRLGFEEDTANAAAETDAGNASGLCQDFDDINGNLHDIDSSVDPQLDALPAQTAIVAAFHWDMLTGDEMFEAAKAGGLADSDAEDYKSNFGGLTHAQKLTVVGWFGDDNILARIDGTVEVQGATSEVVTLGHQGITTLDQVDDRTGNATVTVKVSDAVGRLIPAESGGRNQVVTGQTFVVTAVRSDAPDVPDFQSTDETDSTDLTAIFGEPSGTGNKVEFVQGTATNLQGAPAVEAKVNVRVSPGRSKIFDIDLGIYDSNDNGDPADDGAGALLPHHQAINFSLSNGGSPFRVSKDNDSPDVAQVVLAAGQELTSAGSHSFYLDVNEYNRAPQNSTRIEVNVTVVVDNVAPTFDTGQPTSGTVAEGANDYEVGRFTGSDANNQVVTFVIRHKDFTDGANTKADESEQFTKINDHAENILESLDIAEFRTTGVLKTKSRAEKVADSDIVDPDDYPDFIEVPGDNPDTDDDESDISDLPSVNEYGNKYTFVVALNDGTLDSVESVEFTLTVTDIDDPLPGSRQVLTIREDNSGTVDNALAPAVDIAGATGYDIDQQIHTAGGNTYIYDQADDEVKILFNIDEDSGEIFLKRRGTLDYEEGPRTYTLSVSATVGSLATSQIIVINIEDVDEAPQFAAADKRLQTGTDPDPVAGPKRDEDGNLVDKDGDVIYDLSDSPRDGDGNYTGDPLKVIDLYVLESAAVGESVKIGLDAGGNPKPTEAKFAATDEDDNADNPDWSNVSYDILYDADLTDDEMSRDELYAGADAMVRMESDGSIVVNRALNTDGVDADEAKSLTLRAFNVSEADEPRQRIDTLEVRVHIIDTNVAPVFDEPSRAQTHASVSEGLAVGSEVFTYRATDEDGDTVRYRLRDQDDAPFFTVEETKNADDEEIGVLRTAAGLDYETQTEHTVEIQAYDTDGDTDEIVITVDSDER